MVVLLKPEHGRKILADKPGKGFSPKAEYIFLKQLEEADAIVVNKADKLSEEQQQTLLDQIAKRFPNVPAICASAKTESNFDAVVALTEQPRRGRTAMMDVDYDVYAAGEAELGWLNCQIKATAAEPFWLDEMVVQVVSGVGSGLRDCTFKSTGANAQQRCGRKPSRLGFTNRPELRERNSNFFSGPVGQRASGG